MTSPLVCERTKTNSAGWRGSSKSYILSSTNNSRIDLFAFHLSRGKITDRAAPRGNAAPRGGAAAPNVNRDPWSGPELPQPHFLRGLGRASDDDPDLPKCRRRYAILEKPNRISHLSLSHCVILRKNKVLVPKKGCADERGVTEWS